MARNLAGLGQRGLELASQAERLARIEQKIVEGEGRITRLLGHIERCELAGHDTRQTNALLQSFQDVLAVWTRERATILGTWQTDAVGLAARLTDTHPACTSVS